jgi:hypothetical protein
VTGTLAGITPKNLVDRIEACFYVVVLQPGCASNSGVTLATNDFSQSPFPKLHCTASYRQPVERFPTERPHNCNYSGQPNTISSQGMIECR